MSITRKKRLKLMSQVLSNYFDLQNCSIIYMKETKITKYFPDRISFLLFSHGGMVSVPFKSSNMCPEANLLRC